MKNKLFGERLGDSAKLNIVEIIAVVCGFWISQLLALYYFSGYLMSGEASPFGPLTVSVFAVFFILHVLRPCSKLAAILGLCSVGVVAGFIEYITSSMFTPHRYSPNLFMLLSVALAFGGLVLDAVKCSRWAVKAGEPRPLKLTGAPVLQPQTTFERSHFDIL